MVRLTHQANFTLDKNTIRELAKYSAMTGHSKSSIVDIAVSQYIMDNKTVAEKKLNNSNIKNAC